MAGIRDISLDGTTYSIVDQIYPVGSIYMSVNSTDPGTLFGGTWTQIKDRFLLACGSTYANGATGGEATHTLTENEMPTHKHLSGNVNSSVKGTTSGNQWMTLMTRAANDETSYNTNTSSVGGVQRTTTCRRTWSSICGSGLRSLRKGACLCLTLVRSIWMDRALTCST